MASVKLYLDTRKPRKDGTCPIKLAFSHHKSFLVPIGAHVMPEEWNGQKVVMPNDKQEQNRLNDLVDNRFSNAKNIIRELRIMGRLRNVSDAELKTMVESNNTVITREDAPILLEECFREYMRNMANDANRDTYHAALNKIKSFAETSALPVSVITRDWVKSFSAFMEQGGLGCNTRIKYLQNLRAVIYDAMEKDLVLMKNPFFKFRFPKYTPRKRALSIEDIKVIRDFECEAFMEQYRDMFMLTFYLIGINAGDLLRLKGIKGGRIEYYRSKTGRFYSIKVEPEALAIIEKYRGEKYLLNPLDRYAKHRDYLRKINNNLQKMGQVCYVPNNTKPKGNRVKSGPDKKEYKPLFPDLSTYWARHSWATIAAGLDIPKETIAAALGHEIGSKITSIYIDFDQKKVDEANRKVIDALK